jgi:hypothetical protein
VLSSVPVVGSVVVFGSFIFWIFNFLFFVSVFVPTRHYQLILVVVHVCRCSFEWCSRTGMRVQVLWELYGAVQGGFGVSIFCEFDTNLLELTSLLADGTEGELCSFVFDNKSRRFIGR